MNIHLSPHSQQLVQEQIAAGHYRSPEEVIERALEALAEKEQTASSAQEPASKRQRPAGRKSLAQLFAESPFKGLDLDFERDRDSGRDIRL